jgi:hypothetical protein
MPNINTNIKAQHELMERLQAIGLPVQTVVDGKPYYSRDLTAREDSDAAVIIDAYNAGRFDYLDNRVIEYNKIGIREQLDMLWHDMENGTTVWRDTIRTIKETYPKPG